MNGETPNQHYGLAQEPDYLPNSPTYDNGISRSEPNPIGNTTSIDDFIDRDDDVDISQIR